MCSTMWALQRMRDVAHFPPNLPRGSRTEFKSEAALASPGRFCDQALLTSLVAPRMPAPMHRADQKHRRGSPPTSL